MKVLLVKPKYIGDTLLLTAAARAVKSALPDAEIHAAVRDGTEGILAGSPDIARIHTLARPKEHGRTSAGLGRDLAVVRRLREERYDVAVELSDADRGRFVTLLSGARRRVANRHPVHMRSAFWRALFSGTRAIDNRMTPRVAWDQAIALDALGLPPAAPVPPVFARERADFAFAEAAACRRPALFVHPAASLPLNMWPAEKWSETLRTLSRDHAIFLSCGPSASEIAYVEAILNGLPDRSAVRFTGGKLSWPAMAGTLYSSCAYLGADTAAMHLASACGLPIAGIFGRDAREHLAQWTAPGRTVAVTRHAGETDIAAIPVGRVLAAVETLFSLP